MSKYDEAMKLLAEHLKDEAEANGNSLPTDDGTSLYELLHEELDFDQICEDVAKVLVAE